MIVFAAAEVVAEAVAETVLLKVDIGSKQVQEVFCRRTAAGTCLCVCVFASLWVKFFASMMILTRVQGARHSTGSHNHIL